MCIMGKTKIGDSSGMCRRMMRLDFWLTGMDGKNHGILLAQQNLLKLGIMHLIELENPLDGIKTPKERMVLTLGGM